MCWMYWYSENRWVLSNCLKLCWASDHAVCCSVSSRQSDPQERRPDDHTCWDCVVAQPVDDDWRNAGAVEGSVRVRNAVVLQVPRSLAVKAVMHRQHELICCSSTSRQWRLTCISCDRPWSHSRSSLCHWQDVQPLSGDAVTCWL